MKSFRLSAIVVLLCCFVPSIASAQDEAPDIAGVPPKILLLVRQEFEPGRAAERRKLEVATARACEKLNVPNSWIALESLTGPTEALSFDPFDSFEQLDAAYAGWGQIYSAHPDLSRMQDEIKSLLVNERSIIAVRRDDLGSRWQTIDFSKARFLRVLEVRLNPGHESEFEESSRSMGGDYEKFKSDVPWVVYQVNSGIPAPAFFVFVPMRALRQNDDLLDWRRSLREAEGDEAAQRAEQLARDAFAFSETTIYAVNPEQSHVTAEFADGDPGFWTPKVAVPAAASAAASAPAATKPAPRKEAASKPQQ
ncbi:MAG TPA: hypothetical protein VEI73_10225 [Candidatus Acidoferrum sp.]|nr:hypothetical protein [Candidatus Acidoferrum sp.]